MLHKYIHYTWQFALLTTVIMVLVHRNTSHNREQWRHWAPPATPEAKKYRKKHGQGGGFTENFRATPAPLLATSFVFPLQFISVLFWATTFLFRSHWSIFWPHLFLSGNISPFFGPQLYFSGNIGPFFGPHLFFSGNISPFLGHNFTFQVTLVLFLGHTFSFRATSVF